MLFPALACLLLIPACVALPHCTKPLPQTAPKTMPVALGSQTFTLELALDNETRTKGLGGRTELASAYTMSG